MRMEKKYDFQNIYTPLIAGHTDYMDTECNLPVMPQFFNEGLSRMSFTYSFPLQKGLLQCMLKQSKFSFDGIPQNKPVEGSCTHKCIRCRLVVLRFTPLYILASTPGVFGSPASCSSLSVSDSRKVWI